MSFVDCCVERRGCCIVEAAAPPRVAIPCCGCRRGEREGAADDATERAKTRFVEVVKEYEVGWELLQVLEGRWRVSAMFGGTR